MTNDVERLTDQLHRAQEDVKRHERIAQLLREQIDLMSNSVIDANDKVDVMANRVATLTFERLRHRENLRQHSKAFARKARHVWRLKEDIRRMRELAPQAWEQLQREREEKAKERRRQRTVDLARQAAEPIEQPARV